MKDLRLGGPQVVTVSYQIGNAFIQILRTVAFPSPAQIWRLPPPCRLSKRRLHILVHSLTRSPTDERSRNSEFVKESLDLCLCSFLSNDTTL